ncbi:MAG: hypothetical protein A3K75_00925, partial [Euryarchaeota archaeon RBG_13_61_15]
MPSLSAEPSTVYVGWMDEIINWNPLNVEMKNDYVACNLIFSSLFVYDEDLSMPVMDLATGYLQVVNPDDTMTTTVTITDSAYFRNAVDPDDMSHPLTASDVVFTLNTIIENPAGAWDRYLKNVTSVNFVSDYVFEVVTDYPKATLIDDLCGIPIIPEFQWSTVSPGDFLNSVHPEWLIGSGPFCYGGSSAGSWYMFTRVPNYHGETDYGEERTVKIDEIFYVLFADEANAAQNLNDGNLDAVVVTGDLGVYENTLGVGSTVDVVKQAVSENGICDVAINAIPLELRTISWGTGKPVLLDPIVRQAIMMTLDKDYIVTELLGGYAVKADSVIGPGYWHKDIDPETPFNPVSAKALLMANGYPDDIDGDGLLEADESSYAVQMGWISVGYELFDIRCQAPNTDPIWSDIVYRWADDAAEAGIGFAPEILTESMMIIKAWYSGDYDVWVWNWGWGPEPLGSSLSVWLSSELEPGGDNVQTPMGPWWEIVDEGLPTEHIHSAYDENYSKALGTMDRDERKVYVDLLQQFVYDSYCESPPYYNMGLYGFTEERYIGWGDWEAHVGRTIMTPLPWLWFDVVPESYYNVGPSSVDLSPSSNPVAAGFEVEFRSEAFDADGDQICFYIEYGDGSGEVAQALGDTGDTQYYSFSHTYEPSGSYSAVLWADDMRGFVDSNVSVSVLMDVTDSSRNVAFRWYDMFNVPFGEYYDYRLISSGGYPVVSMTDSYPYVFDCAWSSVDVWTYSNMRLEVDAVNLPDISMDTPLFVPLLGGVPLEGNATVDWDMHYGTFDEIYYNYSEFLGSLYDGWMTVNKVNVTMNETAAIAILGISESEYDDFASAWAARGAEISDAYYDWMKDQGQTQHDIFNMIEYPFSMLYWPSVCEAEKVGESVVLRLDFVTWGMEALMTKWLRASFMPTEQCFEDFSMHAEIGPSTTDLSIDTAVAYAVNAYTSVLSGMPCWRWEGRLQDVLASTYLHPVSNFDPYEGLTFESLEPGNELYGTMVYYNQHTPGAFGLAGGETLTFEWPAGDQMFIEHLEPGVSQNVTAPMTVTYM